MLAIEPGKDIQMSSETVISPPGQAIVSGGNDRCDRNDSALHLLAASHRVSDRTASDALTTMLALKDSEARNSDRFAEVLNAIKSEASMTRETFLKNDLEKERFKSLKLEVLAK